MSMISILNSEDSLLVNFSHLLIQTKMRSIVFTLIFQKFSWSYKILGRFFSFLCHILDDSLNSDPTLTHDVRFLLCM